MLRNQYRNIKIQLFLAVSYKLGRGASHFTASDAIRAVNEVAIVYFMKCM